MKNKALAMALLSAAVLASGCDKRQHASVQLEKIVQDTKETASDIGDYTIAQKAEFTGKMQGGLDAINKDLSSLDARIEKAGDAVQADAKPKLLALHEKADQLGRRIESAKNATESDWNGIKAEAGNAYGELKDEVKETRQWVSDKIAP